jgi:hypothetical protein
MGIVCLAIRAFYGVIFPRDLEAEPGLGIGRFPVHIGKYYHTISAADLLKVSREYLQFLKKSQMVLEFFLNKEQLTVD